ncbi:copper chaperone PCu(A)C [Actinomadura macrotermitis]|uniref:hypothetical protein n=1 Tax=Actinomadura macrotermitis TaxID=2585200 RepID=UPI0012956A3A|nr:hypothetical protein [Actinomadura macrotermitis]
MAALAIAGAVAIAPVISGCGAGEEPQTAAPTRLTEAVNASVPEGRPALDLRNVFLLGPQPEQALAPGASLPLYGTIINQRQDRADKLVAVSAEGFAQAKITGGSLALPPADASGRGSSTALLGQAAASPAPQASASASPTASAKPGKKPSAKPSATTSATPAAGASTEPAAAPPAPPAAGGKAPLVVLTGLNRQLLGGETIKVTLQFEKAGKVELSVPVIPQQGEYASYPAATGGTPLPGASASASPAATDEHGATPSAGATPSEGGHEGATASPTATPSGH